MPELETLDANSPAEEILEVFERDGACILADAISATKADEVMAEVMPFVERTRFG